MMMREEIPPATVAMTPLSRYVPRIGDMVPSNQTTPGTYYLASEVETVLREVREVLQYHLDKHAVACTVPTTVDWTRAKDLLAQMKEQP